MNNSYPMSDSISENDSSIEFSSTMLLTTSLTRFFRGGLPPLRPDPLEQAEVRLVILGSFLTLR